MRKYDKRNGYNPNFDRFKGKSLEEVKDELDDDEIGIEEQQDIIGSNEPLKKSDISFG